MSAKNYKHPGQIALDATKVSLESVLESFADRISRLEESQVMLETHISLQLAALENTVAAQFKDLDPSFERAVTTEYRRLQANAFASYGQISPELHSEFIERLDAGEHVILSTKTTDVNDTELVISTEAELEEKRKAEQQARMEELKRQQEEIEREQRAREEQDKRLRGKIKDAA